MLNLCSDVCYACIFRAGIEEMCWIYDQVPLTTPYVCRNAFHAMAQRSCYQGMGSHVYGWCSGHSA